MKKIVFLIVCMLTIITCGTYTNTTSWTDVGTDGVMVEIMDKEITQKEFEELCLKDTLASDLNNWVRFGFPDEENKLLEQWLYIKDTDTNTFYVITPLTDSTYRFTIRTIKQ